MKVFVDTNLFIDILLGREPFLEASAAIYRLCENDMIEGMIAPITVNNIYYICRKARHIDEIKAFLADLSMVFDIAVMDERSIVKANRIPIKDYEDALQYAMALQNGCHSLVTRNTKDFKKLSKIEVVTPEEFIAAI
jgi:predicted nucleic acid-binding protein